MSEDNRPIVDPELEWEADQSGVIHLRKHPGGTQFLEGYGTTNFGMKSYEPRRRIIPANVLISAGLLTAGIFSWKNKERISNELRRMGDYALLVRESLR